MNQLLTTLTALVGRYNVRQRVVMIVLAIATVSVLFALLMWANRPEMELLFRNLDPEAANAVVTELSTADIRYELENGGTAIYVPAEKIPEMRLRFAEMDIIKDGIAGYEIFETANMGMTTFMQRLNMRRALEGELTRTINSFSEVQQSRVHLVIPENRLFEEDQRGSASVVLHLRPGARLNTKQLNGIASLVASSAEGIGPEDVVVMDSRGTVLVDAGEEGDAGMASAGDQWQLQNTIEAEFRQKVTELVEGVVGPNNSVVNVTVALDFDQYERTVEEFDPEKTVVLSEETYTETSAEQGAGSDFKAEKVTSNYELSKKLERFVSSGGNIKRLSVAVLVNGRYSEVEQDGELVREYAPRAQQELDQIAALVRSSVGFSNERGDLVEVQNMKFDESTRIADREYFQDVIEQERWEKYILWGLIALAFIVGFFVLRSLLRSTINISLPPGGGGGFALATGGGGAQGLAAGQGRGAAPGGRQLEGGQAAGELGPPPDIPQPEPDYDISEDLYIRKLSPEARARLKANDKMTKKVLEFSADNPEATSKLLRSWMNKSKGEETEKGASNGRR